MNTKTNAVRLVEQAGIPCREAFYEFDENDLNGMHAAEALNYPPEQVFKTLVTTGSSRNHYVFLVPVCRELNLKKAAKAVQEKSMEMLKAKDLLPLTGYVHGGCSPIGMKKHFPTYIHETCTAFPYIYISAGIRGLQIKIAADDLIKETKAEICSLFTE